MRYQTVQVVDNDNNKKYKKIIWMIVMTMLIAAASYMAFDGTWGDYLIYRAFPVIAMCAGMVSAILVYVFKEKFPWIRLLVFVPWLSVLIPAGITGGFNGARIWIDVMLYNWNKIHEGGLGLLPVNGSNADILAFSLFMCTVIGQLSFWFASINSLVPSEIHILFWISIQLVSGNINVLSCGLLIAAGLVMAISGTSYYLTFRSIALSIIIVVIFAASARIKTDEAVSITQLRHRISTAIDNTRYGKSVLPEGDVSKADKLLSSEDNMLTVWSEQEKDIYLKGFVGVNYDSQTSKWSPLPDSAYGGDNYGMLEWLYKKGFNPLEQTAKYYSMSEREDKPVINTIRVSVNEASRKYIYAPASTSEIVKGNSSFKKDMFFKAKGILGNREAQIMEVSDTKPSELMIAEEWLADPDTVDQAQYVQAEAVYRNFVYDNYMNQSEYYYLTMRKMFWDDYNPETEGIYSAVSRVREVLKDELNYTDSPDDAPDNEDALMWYITQAHQGNAVIYASIAVEALRTYGIPARYVEGYYVSSSALDKSINGEVKLTGRDSHAWVEVYFDGIGWQPVDVTPGYFYDAVALQQMVSSPDAVHKTARIDEDDSEMGNVVDNQEVTSASLPEKLQKRVKDISKLVLGIIAVIFIILAIIISIIEIIRMCLVLRNKRRYNALDSNGKAVMLEKRIYRYLSISGINATLGWKIHDTDEELTHKMNGLAKGDYERACVIFEKVVYGGVLLEEYEIRTLEIFAENVYRGCMHAGLKSRILLRMSVFLKT